MSEERVTSGNPRKVTVGKSTITVVRTFGNKDLKNIFSDYVVKKACDRMNMNEIKTKVS